MDIEKNIRQLKNDQKRVDKNIQIHKQRFIEEIKSGLGKQILEDINNKKEKEIKEEPQTKCLFRKMKGWISSLLGK